MENNKYLQIINETYESVSLSSLSPLMEGREQLKMAAPELNGMELNIIAVDYIKYTKNDKEVEHCVILFDEYPGTFYFGGMKLSAWVKGVLEKVERDEFNEYLNENPVKVRFEIIKTTNNNRMLDFTLAF